MTQTFPVPMRFDLAVDDLPDAHLFEQTMQY